jgi:restriction endonuclease S subunit
MIISKSKHLVVEKSYAVVNHKYIKFCVWNYGNKCGSQAIQIDRQNNRRTNRQTDGVTEQTDEQTDGVTEQTNKQTDGVTEQQTND